MLALPGHKYKYVSNSDRYEKIISDILRTARPIQQVDGNCAETLSKVQQVFIAFFTLSRYEGVWGLCPHTGAKPLHPVFVLHSPGKGCIQISVRCVLKLQAIQAMAGSQEASQIPGCGSVCFPSEACPPNRLAAQKTAHSKADAHSVLPIVSAAVPGQAA